MDRDYQKIRKLTKFMRSHGILTLKSGNIELTLDKSALYPKPAVQSPAKMTQKERMEAALRGDHESLRLICWSSPAANKVPVL